MVSRPELSVKIQASAPRGIHHVDYLIDGSLLENVSAFPFNLTRNISDLSSGFHDLTIRVCDDIDNCSEQKINFNFKK